MSTKIISATEGIFFTREGEENWRVNYGGAVVDVESGPWANVLDKLHLHECHYMAMNRLSFVAAEHDNVNHKAVKAAAAEVVRRYDALETLYDAENIIEGAHNVRGH